MIPAAFEYHAPESLKETLRLLSEASENAKLLAGGQSLVPLMKLRLARPKVIIDLNRIPGLRYIRDTADGHILIGALTNHAELERSGLLNARCSLLSRTAATIGDVQVRNQGTIGGSLAHADPAGDMPAAILALGADLKAIGPKGERWIRAEEFFLGFLTTALEPDEVLTEIRVPLRNDAKAAYLKAAQRASGFAVVGVAVALESDREGRCRDIGIGVTGVAEKPYRASEMEKILRGKKLESKLIQDAAAEIIGNRDIIEDINGSKEYRSHLARVYAARAIETALRA